MSRSAPPGLRPADLLPDLHRRMLEATGGLRSVVLRQTPNGDYRAVSARGLAELGDVWLSDGEAVAVDRFLDEGVPGVTTLTAFPTLALRLQTATALLMPIAPARSRTVIAVGVEPTVSDRLAAALPLTTGFAAALELLRLEREVRFHRRLRELTLLFSRGVSSTQDLTSALETLAHEVAPMLGAAAAAVWLHDRRARELELVASSDHAVTTRTRVPTEDTGHPAARGLRLDRPRLSEGFLIAQLRGWRRALGTLVFSGVMDSDLDEPQLVDFASELGHQLSAGIENVQLLGEILRQRRLLEDTFNSLVDLVVVTDRDLGIVQTNEAFATHAGVSRPDAIGHSIRDFVGPETAAWIETAGLSPVGIGPVEDPRLGGTFLLTATPLVNQDSQTIGRVLVARDITRQTRLEQEREALRARLAQSEKLASLGQFVAGIAHEMNNPLQGVLGHLELLIDTSEPARPLRRELRQIYLDADRAAKIVRNLLVFTGSRRMAPRRLQIERVVTRALASRSATLKRTGIEVRREQTRDLPTVLGDTLLLQEAFLNILINAEHAVSDETLHVRRIDIGTATDPARERVTITIRDTGPGVDAEILPRVFDPFFTTKEVGQGTGLGLAITYGIVQEHGGTISVANAPDGGAIFSVDLPSAGVVVK